MFWWGSVNMTNRQRLLIPTLVPSFGEASRAWASGTYASMRWAPRQDRAPCPLTISCCLSTPFTQSSNEDRLAQPRHSYYARPPQPAEGIGAYRAASAERRGVVGIGRWCVFLASSSYTHR